MATAHAEMHAEHRQWLADISLWRDEGGLWEKEIDRAIADLKKLEDVLRTHRKEVEHHLDALIDDQAALKEHEHAMAAFERGAEGEDLLVMARSHKGRAANHDQNRRAHEDLKKRQHTIIAQWSLLVRALTHKPDVASPRKVST